MIPSFTVQLVTYCPGVLCYVQADARFVMQTDRNWFEFNIHSGSTFWLHIKPKLHGLSPRANYTDRANAACRRSDCKLLWIEVWLHIQSTKLILIRRNNSKIFLRKPTEWLPPSTDLKTEIYPVSKTLCFLVIYSFGLESREYGGRDPSRWPNGTLYPQKLAITSLTSGNRSVGIVR
jgi:hypothetical protein